MQTYLDAKDEMGDEDAGNSDATFLRATHIISALPLPVLDSILQVPAGVAASTHTTPIANTTSLSHLRANPHASVIVLNLVFRNPSGAETTPLHPPGFGYLVPRPEHGYDYGCHPSRTSTPGQGPGSETGTEAGAEPEPRSEREETPGLGLLGVVFDTASLPEQDDDATTAAFTKLTAMLGGPYQYTYSSSSSLSDAEFVAAVLPRIGEHLGRALPPPVHYAVHRNEECIPAYLVGHTARMGELRRAVRERWGGRMKVVGSGVGGVSVADCVKAGRQAAYEVGAQIGT